MLFLPYTAMQTVYLPVFQVATAGRPNSNVQYNTVINIQFYNENRLAHV